MLLEDTGREGLLVGPPQHTLAGKVKQEGVVMVEFVQGSAVFWGYQTHSETREGGGKRGGGRF